MGRGMCEEGCLHDYGVEFVVDDRVAFVLTKVLWKRMSVYGLGGDVCDRHDMSRPMRSLRRSLLLSVLFSSYGLSTNTATSATGKTLTAASVARCALLGIANPLLKTLATALGLVYARPEIRDSMLGDERIGGQD